MNLTVPVLKGAAHVAELPGGSVTSFLKIGADDSPDGVLGLLMSGLSGVAAALAVAIVLTVYFRSRSSQLARSSSTALPPRWCSGCSPSWPTTCGMRRSAYLGINPAKPAVEFEIRLPKAALIGGGRHPGRIAHRPKPKARQVAGRAGLGRQMAAPCSRVGAAGLSDHRRAVVARSAGPGPAPVQAAARGKPKPFRSVRAVASGRPRPPRQTAKPTRTEPT